MNITSTNIKAIAFWGVFLVASTILSETPVLSQSNGASGANMPKQPVMDSLATDSMAMDTTGVDSAAVEKIYTLDRVVVNNAFRVGEKLTFNIRYGIFKAGEAVMEVREKTLVHDSIPAYRIVTTARSAKFFDAFYKVRDVAESYLDERGLFSWRYYKQLREGGYKFDLDVNYNQPYGKAQIHSIRYHKKEPLTVRKEKDSTIDVPQYILDVLGGFYYIRTQRLEVGEPIYMPNHDNSTIYQLKVIIQKRERIKVPAGRFDCILIKPILQGDAIFKQKGELWIWLTDDERKIPVKMKSKVAVGSITTELKSIEGVEPPIRARVN